jgi:type II secretory pathway component PulC
LSPSTSVESPSSTTARGPAPSGASSSAQSDSRQDRRAGDTDDAATPMTGDGAVRRSALDVLLTRGPGALLALVSTAPCKRNGRFIGFRIVAFNTPIPDGLDLRINDIVIAVNGLKIIMPDDYFRVFQALKVAGELRFELEREGKKLEQVYPIVN